MQIVQYQMLDMQNVVCCETDINSSDDRSIAQKVQELTREFGANERKKSMFVLKRNQERAAIEAILFPVGLPHSNADDRYKFKEKLHLESALKIRHEGDWDMLENTIQCLDQFIEKRDLTRITTYYCSVLTGLEDDELRDVIVDVYVGLSQNIL